MVGSDYSYSPVLLLVNMHVRHINVVVDDQTLNHPHHLPPRHGEDLIVTPFAQVESKCFFQPFDSVLQILASLRSVRNNYVTLTNVRRKREAVESGTEVSAVARMMDMYQVTLIPILSPEKVF